MAKSNPIPERLKQLEVRIQVALRDSMWDRSGLTVVAVSKRQPLASVLQAYEAGMRHFGENQIQEGIPKIKAAPEDITWHFIGNLQKNKVRKAVKHFHYIHSVDSLSLLQRIDSIAGEERVHPKICLQVDYGLDPDKFGLHPDAVHPVLEAALSCHNIDCIGLMAIPPVAADAAKIDTFFRGMATMRDGLQDAFPLWEGRLSLGMSADFEAAVRVGSHFIRIGSSLFGERR